MGSLKMTRQCLPSCFHSHYHQVAQTGLSHDKTVTRSAHNIHTNKSDVLSEPREAALIQKGISVCVLCCYQRLRLSQSHFLL